MLRRLRRDEGGWTVVTALFAMTLMLGLGLGMLSVVDTQTAESRKERVADASFNLAEGVLNSTAFLLSRGWPELGSQSPTGSPSACSAQQLTGGLGPAAVTTTAGRIQKLVTDTYTSTDYAGATWKVNVCDDLGRQPTWTDALLGAWSYDQNGPDPSTGARRLWVRAQATVQGRSKAVAALVQVNETPALPARYGLITGKLQNDIGTVTGAVLSDSVLRGLTGPLLQSKRLVAPDPADAGSGKIGVRCGLLQLCLTGALTALHSTPLLSSLLGSEIVQYADDRVARDETIALLRRQAEAMGSYYPTRNAGDSCIPSGLNPAGRIVFIEQVGNGDQTCEVDLGASKNVSAKALVVASGRVLLDGDHTNHLTHSGRFTGVVYAVNRQRQSSSPVVRIERGARVVGAVYADGDASVLIKPPPLDLNDVLCDIPVLNLTCLLNLGGVLNAALGALGVDGLVSALLPSLTSYGPAIQYNAAVVNAVTTYGSSGTIAGTFREIPAT